MENGRVEQKHELSNEWAEFSLFLQFLNEFILFSSSEESIFFQKFIERHLLREFGRSRTTKYGTIETILLFFSSIKVILHVLNRGVPNIIGMGGLSIFFKANINAMLEVKRMWGRGFNGSRAVVGGGWQMVGFMILGERVFNIIEVGLCLEVEMVEHFEVGLEFANLLLLIIDHLFY